MSVAIVYSIPPSGRVAIEEQRVVVRFLWEDLRKSIARFWLSIEPAP